MLITDYHDDLLRQNRLRDEATAFLDSEKASWYVKRVITPPTAMTPNEAVAAAATGGILLLRQWCYERQLLTSDGLLVSRPVLLIDEKWLMNGAPAAAPKLTASIAREMAHFAPPTFVDHGGDDIDKFPLRDSLRMRLPHARVVRASVRMNPIAEPSAFWLIFG